MPVQLLGRVGVVVDIDDSPLAFLEAEQRTRKLAIISGGGDDAVRRQLDEPGADPDGVIRAPLDDDAGSMEDCAFADPIMAPERAVAPASFKSERRSTDMATP